MDPHFKEYLAAVAGMHDIYGDGPDDHRTEFHEDGVIEAVPAPVVTTA